MSTTTPPVHAPHTGRRLLTAALATVVMGGTLSTVEVGTRDQAAAAAVSGTSAAAVKAHVLFSGGRTTDVRVGEPLSLTVRGQKIRSVCWTPAPVDRPACSTRPAAAAAPGTQRLRITFASGGTLRASLKIGAAVATVAPDVDAAGAAGAHPALLVASCATAGYANYNVTKRELRGKEAVLALDSGDHVAAYYRAGPGVIQGYGLRGGHAAFFPGACLKPAK